MTKRPIFVISVVLSFVFILLGCARTGNATSYVSETSSTIESQLAAGAPIYYQTCATNTCHGANGEGIRSGDDFKVWPLVGDEFQSRHPNAQIVFDVIRSGSERNLLALTDQQIYNAIAYELSQNEIRLESPLTAENAHETFGGKMTGETQSGLFPPSDNAVLIDMPPMRALPIAAQNDRLGLQLDQIAQASAIGNTKPRGGGTFLILVIAFTDLSDEPITVSPDHLKLSTQGGELLQPQPVNIQSAIEKFHERTMNPQHGTVGLVVFTLSAPEDFDQLIYDDGVGEPLTLALRL